MNGLRTTRVLVLDDKISEALPFIEALAKRSIGMIYFSGENDDEFPTANGKLTGIRLAALDLDLGIGGEAPAVIGRLLTVLNKVLAKDNGPYLAIAWTSKDETYFSEFRDRISELECPPINLIRMKKADYKGSTGLDAIFNEVTNSVAEAYPLGLLSFWEQTLHDSSATVLQMLPSPTAWAEQSRQTLQLILKFAAPESDTSVAKLAALLSAFNSIQLDSIESAIGFLQEAEATPLISPLDGGDIPDAMELATKINFRLLCTEAPDRVVPGNIYRCDEISSPTSTVFPTLDDLLNDMVNAKEEDARAQKRQSLKDAGCVPIAMEITPLCDYQQSRIRLPRFVCGIALPFNGEDLTRLLKPLRDSMRALNDPIRVEDGQLAGTKLLVWNSRYIVSAPTNEINSEARLLRLRQTPLIDVQAWLASQLNRPGYLSLGVR